MHPQSAKKNKTNFYQVLKAAFNLANESTILNVLHLDKLFVERIVYELKACAKDESAVMTLLRVLEDAVLVSANADPMWIMKNLVERKDLWNSVIATGDKFSAKVTKKIDSIQDLIKYESLNILNDDL